jgi:CubicO group peptidase (beta-lactamase class C family)
MHAAGGHGASIKDLVIWMRFNLTGRSASGRPVLSAESLHEMHEPQAEQSRRLPIPGQTRTGYGLGWNIGEYKGKTVLEHGGSYVGTSAAISFLPEEQIGVAVLLNAQSPLTLVFTADVFDRLLGVRPTDILPRMKKGYDRSKARRSTEHGSADSDPASSSDRLSLDPRAYVGRYANHMWGTIKIDLQDRRLVARMGTLPLELVLHGTDRFSVRNSGGTPIAGRFVVHADSTVGAVLLAIDEEGNEVAFDKQ